MENASHSWGHGHGWDGHGGHTDGTRESRVMIMIHDCFRNTFLKEFFKEWSWSVMVMVMGGPTRVDLHARDGGGVPGSTLNLGHNFYFDGLT